MQKNIQTPEKNVTERLREVLQENRRTRNVGVYSICSANRYVLEASMSQARRDDSMLLIESTSNQVNQFGGYTLLTPADFARFVRDLANNCKFPLKDIVLGGDHLGPQVWRKEPASQAMVKACNLVRDSVLAGYTKIHLDSSMPCADDAGDRYRPLVDEIVSARAAEMCQAAEQAFRTLPAGTAAPLYVIGTEVPIPGGELPGGKAPETTRTEDLEQTLRVTKEAFRARGLTEAWERVIAVVVQPGAEFGDDTVVAYDAAKAAKLSKYADAHWQGVYEAHSTDYQTAAALRQMVQDHFAILKVGPWLTFAFREAVFALELMEREWLGRKAQITLSGLSDALERAMVENPTYWREYYRGEDTQLKFARKFSYSDRSRYYWPVPGVAAALGMLLANLTSHPMPASLLSQYLPKQSDQVREGKLENKPVDLIRSKILEVLNQYATACGAKRPLIERGTQC